MARQLNHDDKRRVLNRAHSYLVQNMSLTAEVLTHMRDKGLITENDHKDISDLQTEAMRNRILLSKVSKQEKGGEGGYDLLKSCLREMGHAQCAELMEEKERELLTESFGLRRTEGKYAYILSPKT
ncbi:hypothetical protein MAR_009400 [Mya arenaria]|uniref:CARD domain-containing protein n=1 Tax=Mya arenaria TaxID=6604 RepID=A0ABY7DYN7_MYAAR|nr:hypothetical protein MAR_009400 [Mya arenaria]